MPIKAAAQRIRHAALWATYRLPGQTDGQATVRTVEVMGANAWYSTLWAVRNGRRAEVLDKGLIPGEYRSAGQAEGAHIRTWALTRGLPEGAQLAARAHPVVLS